jgi:hypothetical protein
LTFEDVTPIEDQQKERLEDLFVPAFFQQAVVPKIICDSFLNARMQP